MKRIAAFLLILVLTVGLLCGCGAEETAQEQKVVCKELSLVLPASFSDFSEQGAVSGLAFNYADVEIGICGIFESKEILLQYIPDITPEGYAQIFVETNGLNSQVEVADGIPRFTYTATGDPSYTYLCGVFESQENFWVVQAYCQQDNYSTLEADMWNYICSVSVK